MKLHKLFQSLKLEELLATQIDGVSNQSNLLQTSQSSSIPSPSYSRPCFPINVSLNAYGNNGRKFESLQPCRFSLGFIRTTDNVMRIKARRHGTCRYSVRNLTPTATGLFRNYSNHSAMIVYV